MSYDWGNDPASDEQEKLQRFLDDLSRKADDMLAESERIRQEWKAAFRSEQWHKLPSVNPPISSGTCPYCLGEGRITHTDTDFTIRHTINEKCPGCWGDGRAIETHERRGVR